MTEMADKRFDSSHVDRFMPMNPIIWIHSVKWFIQLQSLLMLLSQVDNKQLCIVENS